MNTSEILQLSISLMEIVRVGMLKSCMHNYLSAELEINFLDCDQFINEGSISLNVPISLSFRLNQSPFTVILTPVTVDRAESMGLGHFINSESISCGSRAIAGKK